MCSAIKPPGFQPVAVQRHRLTREEMHRDRVAVEGVDHQHVVAPLGSALQEQPAITERHFDGRGRILDEAELSMRSGDDRIVDLVKAVAVAGLAVGGNRAGAQADCAHLDRPVGQRAQQPADAGANTVVAGAGAAARRP